MTELSEAERDEQDYEADRAVDDDRVQDSVERVQSTVMRIVVDHVSLHEALLAVQSQLPRVERGETAVVPTKGGGSYSYKYVDLATVHEAVLPLLNRHGLVWLTKPTLLLQGSSELFTLEWELWHETDQRLSGHFPLQQGNPQQVGSQITYARRYCLLAVLGLAPEDDDGAAASIPPSPVETAMREQQSSSRTPGQNEVARQAERRNIAPQDAITAFAELFGADWSTASESQLFAFAEHLDKYGLSRGGDD